jgi:membrane fusion protein (multidrug efflux system)
MKVFSIMLATGLAACWLLPSAWSQGVTPVIVVEIEESALVDEVEALGTLRANESVTISSTVTELVERIYFDDGQRVNKGDVIIEMDAAEELAQMVEERSRLNQAERELARAKGLVESGAVSESAFDEAQRAFDAATARITAIQSRIDQRILRAPFDGLTGLRMISPGALAQPGTVITTIDDTSLMKLDFFVPSVFLETLRVGLPIEASARAFPDLVFSGEIRGIDSRIDPVTRSIMVRAVIPNQENLLRPGLLMQVNLSKNQRRALTVPEEAVTLDGSNASVWRIETGPDGLTVAQKVPIELGVRQYGEVEVLSGLASGDQVVTHGVDRLRPGAVVRIAAVDDGSSPISELLPSFSASNQ